MTGSYQGDDVHPRGQTQVKALLDAHTHLRQDLEQIRAALRALTSGATVEQTRGIITDLSLAQHAWHVRAFCDRYCRILDAHHGIEDQRLFPALRARDPSLAPVLDELQADHRHLGTLLNRLQAAMSETVEDPGDRDVEMILEELAEHLEKHLAREEHSIVPALSRLTDWV